MTDTVNDAVTDAVTAPATDIEFLSAYDQGFARVAAVTLPVHPARPFENARAIIDAARELDTTGVAIGIFPALCVSGYAIDAIGVGPGQTNFDLVLFYCGLMLVFYVLSSGLSYLLSVLMVKISQKIVYQMRKDLVDKLLELPEGLEAIGDGAFYNCATLGHVKFPSTLKTIGDNAFYNAYQGSLVALPSAEPVGDFAC